MPGREEKHTAIKLAIVKKLKDAKGKKSKTILKKGGKKEPTIESLKKLGRKFGPETQTKKKSGKPTAATIVTNQKGGATISLPGINPITISKNIGKWWTEGIDQGFTNIGKAASYINKKMPKQTQSAIDTILSGFVEKYGLSSDFSSIKDDYNLSIHQAERVASRLSNSIDRIDSVFESAQTQFKKTDFLKEVAVMKNGVKVGTRPATKEEAEARRKALQQRTIQVAQGGITQFADKYIVVREAARQFELLEAELRKRGLLKDHQFKALTRKERFAAILDIKSLDSQIKDISDGTDSETIKAREMKKRSDERLDIIRRLQIHYKNSGSNYLREIRDTVDQTERYKNQLTLDAMTKRFAQRRNNWRTEVDPNTGTIHVRRQKAKNLKNASSLVGKGIMQEAHDLHMHDMFTNIAKQESDLGLEAVLESTIDENSIAPWATKTPDKYKATGIKYVEIPNKSINFGPLAGMFVEKHIYEDMKSQFDEIDKYRRAWNKTFSTWKAGKTVWNPATTARNLVSNFVLADVLGDVNFAKKETWTDLMASWKQMAAIDADLTPMDQYGREIAEQTTITKSSFVTAELAKDGADYITKLIDKTADLQPFDALTHIIKGDESAMGIKKAGMSKIGPYIYNQLETAMKATVYKAARRRGLTIEEATKKAQTALFDYSSVPPAIRFMRNWYSPFITFSYKALPALAKQLARKPWKFAKYYGMVAAAQMMANVMLGEDEEDREAQARALPNYIRDRDVLGIPGHLRMPFRTPDGRDKFLDISFHLPWGGANEMGEGAFGWIPSFLAPTNPLLTLAGSFATKTDIFTGRPIYLDTDKDGTKIMKFLIKVHNEVMPAAINIDKLNKIKNAVTGRTEVRGVAPKYSVWDAMVDYMFGLKFRNVDYMVETMWRHKDLQAKGKEIQMETARQLKEQRRNPNDPTGKSIRQIQEDAMDKMDKLKNEYFERWTKDNDE